MTRTAFCQGRAWYGRAVLGSGDDQREVLLPHPDTDHIATFTALPPGLRRSLTWDRGTEKADHHQISGATGIEIYFADPHSPWQRGSNENTNGLLRQYFPKGTNLAVHSPQRLEQVQDELNGRPRKRYDWVTPTARLAALQCFHE